MSKLRPQSGARTPHVAHRIGAALFLGGAGLTALGMAAPHSAEADMTGFAGLAVAQLAIAALIVRARNQRIVAPFTMAAAIGAIAAGIWFSGERLGGPPLFNDYFYVWPALYVGYFFRTRAVVVSVVGIAVTHAALLAAMHSPDGALFTRWLITVSVTAGTALAVHLIRRHVDGLVAQLREAARTDSLTGLLNRRGFEERFELELERARRVEEPIALLVGDLDDFKQLNDTHGHPAGDAALEAVGQALRDACRQIDSAARLGGEEFALLLPSTRAAAAVRLADRLRSQVTACTAALDTRLTISFGAAELPAHGHSLTQLMRAADAALYTAKETGRDRTVVATGGRLASAA